MLCLLTLTLFLGLRPINVHAETSTIDGLNLNVQMNVNENGVIEVTEEVTVYFNNPQQGIFVVLPQLYSDFDVSGWTNQPNDKRNYFFRITDFTSSTHAVTEDDDSSSLSDLVFRLGTAGQFLTGEQTFKYSYKIHTQDLGLGLDYDVFFMNIKGNGWNFDFENVDFTIQFEKDLPESFPHEIQAGTQESYNVVEIHRDGNTLSGSVGPSRTYEAVTIMAELPHGFFSFANHNFTFVGFGLLVGVLALLIFWFMRYGKDYPIVETVEFTAPDGLSSAEVAYIYNRTVQAKDVTSLIILWASQGFLTLEELDDDTIKISKVSEYHGHNREEERLFMALFEDRDEVTTQELTNTFGQKITFAVGSIPDYFRKDKDKKVYDTKSTGMKVLSSILLTLAFGIYCGLVVYATFGYSGFAFVGFGFAGVLCAIACIIAGIGFPYIKLNKLHQKALIVLYSVGISLMLILVLKGGSLLFRIQVNSLQLICVTLILTLSLILTGLMDRRTQQGARWYGQISGLKRFIEVAEHDRLVKLAEETPTIFYDILPFAYVLGVTDVWSKKFESIAIETPDWYHTTSTIPNMNSIYMWSMLNRSMNTVQRSMISEPINSTSSGRGFGGGGGFGGGSSGGGGFSGGGFGGSGGGGW